MLVVSVEVSTVEVSAVEVSATTTKEEANARAVAIVRAVVVVIVIVIVAHPATMPDAVANPAAPVGCLFNIGVRAHPCFEIACDTGKRRSLRRRHYKRA